MARKRLGNLARQVSVLVGLCLVWGSGLCFRYLDRLSPAQRELQESHHFFELTEAQFDSLVLDQEQEQLWFVFFYAPWCLHCKKVAPVWKSFAQDIEPE